MKDRLNAHVKFREAFRPYAPAVLVEHVDEWFDTGPCRESPFMLRVLPVRETRRAQIAAVVHVDGTGRVQTVDAAHAPRLHRLISAVYRRTGVPVLLQTSLNVAGQPIVESPDDALAVLLLTGLDACVLGDVLVTKPPAWESPLDGRPALAAEWLAQERVVSRGRVVVSSRPGRGPALLAAAGAGQAAQFFDWAARYGTDHVRLTVDGRYGRRVYAATSDVLPVLLAINGRRNGWAVLDHVNGRRPNSFTEASLLALFRSLADAGMLVFHAPRTWRRHQRAHQLVGANTLVGMS